MAARSGVRLASVLAADWEGQSASICARVRLPDRASRASSTRQWPERYYPMVLPHSTLSVSVQGRGVPIATNSNAEKRPCWVIQAFTPAA